jgi:RimJ/RimL family protein N-acetyltransferase
MTVALRTARLLLREWRDEDAAAFAAMSADPAVMRYLPPPHPDAVERMRAHWRRHGFGRFVVEISGDAPFIGIVGLSCVRSELPFAPAVEIAWRLMPAHWGQGYATEAAQAAIADGFGRLSLAEIVAFTVPANEASRRVMTRLGMCRDPSQDFDHPLLPPGHELSRHVLYRLGRPPA